MTNHNPAVICLSGGLDSTSLLVRLLAEGRDVQGISFDYGQKHKIEIQRLQSNLDYLKTNGLNVDWHLIDLSTLSPLLNSALTDQDWEVPTGFYESENMKQTVVPNRNAIFASIAFAAALSMSQKHNCDVDICLGVHSGDHAIYPDCRPEFYQVIFKAFQMGNWESENIHLYLPYIDLDKFRILQDAQRHIQSLGLDFDKIYRNTITSYAPDDQGNSSGLTGSDVERILAFHQLGVADPITYCGDWDSVVAQALAFQNEHLANHGGQD
jgi:7-cyano-7-deazaguanine synthase